MKLNALEADSDHDNLIVRDLEHLLKQPNYTELKPCEGCTRPCPCSASITCTCACEPSCEHAPVEMSSEADRYPIEPNIATMVFGFNTLRICPPYWSCEGHSFANGEIKRVPQVWFYSRSLIYPKLVSEFVLKLRSQALLSNPWHVVVTHADDVLETGFSIEPQTRSIENPDLASMQKDASVIASNFQKGLKAIATRYIEDHTRKVAHAKLEAAERMAKIK